jgi:hypothetical protein
LLFVLFPRRTGSRRLFFKRFNYHYAICFGIIICFLYNKNLTSRNWGFHSLCLVDVLPVYHVLSHSSQHPVRAVSIMVSHRNYIAVSRVHKQI